MSYKLSNHNLMVRRLMSRKTGGQFYEHVRIKNGICKDSNDQEMTLIYLSGLNFATLDAFLMVLLAIFDRPCIADLNPLLP